MDSFLYYTIHYYTSVIVFKFPTTLIQQGFQSLQPGQLLVIAPFTITLVH
jgi:hypothetical protein